MAKPNQPTHDLVILRKSDGKKGRIGAGWLNADGSISIVLNPLTTLTEDPNITIRLFLKTPYNPVTYTPPKPGVYKDQSELHKKPPEEDDVPF